MMGSLAVNTFLKPNHLVSPVSTEHNAEFIVGESNFDFHGINQGQLVFLSHIRKARAVEWMGFFLIL